MPKMKTRSSAKKRFRLTASGKIKHKRAYRSHILTKKSRKRKRKLRLAGVVESGQASKIRHMLAG